MQQRTGLVVIWAVAMLLLSGCVVAPITVTPVSAETEIASQPEPEEVVVQTETTPPVEAVKEVDSQPEPEDEEVVSEVATPEVIQDEPKPEEIVQNEIVPEVVQKPVCQATIADGEVYLSTEGQHITGHQRVTINGYEVIEFFTSIPLPERGNGERERLWAIIPESVLAGQVPVASIFWHGTQVELSLTNQPHNLARYREDMGLPADTIMVYRPDSDGWQKSYRFTFKEVALHIALVEYLAATFAVERFNLWSHSGGTTTALAIAQERPKLTNTVVIASGPMYDRAHYLHFFEEYIKENGWEWFKYHYDPFEHIGKLAPETPILVIHDFRDEIVPSVAILPYINRAEELGLKVKLHEVVVPDGHNPHWTEQYIGKVTALDGGYQSFLSRDCR